jgi:hypothetical protein
MIEYEIVSVDIVNMSMQVRYFAGSNPDYFVRLAFGSPINEENLHSLAQQAAARAEANWERVAAAQQDFQLTTTTGVAKSTVVEDHPEFDPDTHMIVERWEETETVRTLKFDLTPLTQDQKIAAIRAKRNSLLGATDFYLAKDRPVSDEMISYRQALRELPDQTGFPDSIAWPIRPAD